MKLEQVEEVLRVYDADQLVGSAAKLRELFQGPFPVVTARDGERVRVRCDDGKIKGFQKTRLKLFIQEIRTRTAQDGDDLTIEELPDPLPCDHAWSFKIQVHK